MAASGGGEGAAHLERGTAIFPPRHASASSPLHRSPLILTYWLTVRKRCTAASPVLFGTRRPRPTSCSSLLALSVSTLACGDMAAASIAAAARLPAPLGAASRRRLLGHRRASQFRHPMIQPCAWSLENDDPVTQQAMQVRPPT